MKVKELIELLSKVENQDVEVVTEGCDCYGDVYGYQVMEEGDILICRSDASAARDDAYDVRQGDKSKIVKL